MNMISYSYGSLREVAMKLGHKVLAAIVVSWSFMLGVTYLGSVQILGKSYRYLEDQQAQINMNKANDAINTVITSNDTNVISWAVWSDFFLYLASYQDPNKKEFNQKFLETNFKPSAFAFNKPDLFLTFNLAGELVPSFSSAMNADWTQFQPLPKDILPLFQPGGKLRRLVVPPESANDAMGLLSTTNGILVLATHRILPSEGTGSSHGTFAMGQYLSNVWKQIQNSSQEDIQFYTIPMIRQEPTLNKQYTEIITQKLNILQAPINDNTLVLYSTLKDINNTPIGMIKITTSRELNLLSKSTIRYFNLIFIVTGAVLSLLMYYLLRILLIDRLSKINNEIIKIDSTKNFTRRVPENGSDELSAVAIAINRMLSVIQLVESLLSDIVNSMPSLITIVDKDLKVINLNLPAQKATGLSDEMARNKSLLDIFPYLTNYRNQFEKALQENKIQEIRKITAGSSDSVRYVDAIIYPLNRASEKILAIRIDDITDWINFKNHFVQDDKLAVIGTLTAGVAYEIDSPISLIINAIKKLDRNKEDIFNLLNKYSELKSKNDFSENRNDIETLEKQIENYPLKETENLLDKIKIDAGKISSIVINLKNFSRSDENVMKYSNLHDGLDSVLTLLSHNYKDRINIIKEYGQIPEVDCFPGRINQVFMYIMTSAIKAIPQEGEITIKTEQIKDQVKITIKDNGIGISTEEIAKVFDPSFTTTEKTNLGLAIASSIIADHQGDLELKSGTSNKKGTEYIITLPINHFTTKSSQEKIS